MRRTASAGLICERQLGAHRVFTHIPRPAAGKRDKEELVAGQLEARQEEVVEPGASRIRSEAITPGAVGLGDAAEIGHVLAVGPSALRAVKAIA